MVFERKFIIDRKQGKISRFYFVFKLAALNLLRPEPTPIDDHLAFDRVNGLKSPASGQ